MYCTSIKLQFYGHGSQLFENPIDLHLHLIINEFIMTAVLQIYLKSTINRSTLSKIIHYIMRFILLIKLCLWIFLVITPVYLQGRIQSVGMTIHTADQRLYKIYTMVYTYNSCRTNFSEWWLYIPVLCILCIWQTKIEHKKDKKFSRLRITF